jgi:GST-like protein
MIELYGCGSPNVRKIVIMLEELGLSYEKRYVAVLGGGQFEPDFLALNPLGRVPVLVDHDRLPGEPLFESGAILIFLAEAYGRPDLLPAHGPSRYAVLKWLMLQMANIGPILGQNNHFIITPDHADGYAGRRYREQSRRLYRFLDERLSQAAWLAGGLYSVADIATYPWMLYAERHGMDWAALPHLRRWRERIEARDAVARAQQAMDFFVGADAKAVRQATQDGFDLFFWRESRGPRVDLSPMKVS